MRERAAVEATSSEDLAAGLEAYGDRDLEGAIDLLRSAEASGHLEEIRKIYLGSALAWNGAYPEAVSVLQEVSARTLPDPWGSEARWSLYVALKGSGWQRGADSLLHILSEESGEIGERARSRLREILEAGCYDRRNENRRIAE